MKLAKVTSPSNNVASADWYVRNIKKYPGKIKGSEKS